MSAAKRHRFEEITEEIRGAICRGEIASGSLLPSERELQQTHGVSRTTIRRALAELVASGWSEANPGRGVMAKMGVLSPRSSRVAYVDHRDYVHKSLFFKLHVRMAARHLDLVHVDSQDIGTMGALERAADEGFAGAFVWPKLAFVDAMELASIQARLPLIAVDHSIGGEPSDLVMSDHANGARQIVDHLVRLGRRRIAISGNFTNMEDAQLRFAGFVVAMYGNEVAPEACDFVFSSPQRLPYEDTRLLRYRLQESDRPDAVFVLHDMSVPAIAEAVLDLGLSIPNDVAIVGFGNDLPFGINGVGLTTIAMNWDLVSEALIEQIQERWRHPSSPYRRTLIPVRLVVRGSCGAPKEAWDTDAYELSSVTVTGRLQPWQGAHLAGRHDRSPDKSVSSMGTCRTPDVE